MSRLPADFLIALPAILGACVLAAAMTTAFAGPSPMFPTGTVEVKPYNNTVAIAPRHLRDIDVVLYRAHRQLPEAQSGCFDPGTVDFGLQPGEFYPSRRDGTVRSGSLQSF